MKYATTALYNNQATLLSIYERCFHFKYLKTKKQPPQNHPLSERATVIVRQYFDVKNTTLFPLTYTQLGRAFRMACNDAGIADYHFHDIRHEAVSRFTEMGLSPIEVSLISGHRDLRVLMNYSHMRVEAVGAKLR